MKPNPNPYPNPHPILTITLSLTLTLNLTLNTNPYPSTNPEPNPHLIWGINVPDAPKQNKIFPYTIRSVCEYLPSDGSLITNL